MKSVCVIGAGLAGLCAVRHLKSRLDQFDIDVYEQGSLIGGLWNYENKSPFDANGNSVYSTCYMGLKTILPKEVMGFPDFPYDQSVEASFISREQVVKYINNYAEYFNLKRFIKLNTAVTKVAKMGEKFEVSIVDRITKQTQSLVYDVVIVANGHYAIPLFPNIPHLELFKGIKLHARDYSRPDKFSGKTVAVVGANASGCDVALQISNFAKTTYLCSRGQEMNTELPPNLKSLPITIQKCIDSETVELENGSQLKLDAIVFCTGYQYSFPFLSEEIRLKNEHGRLTPLYKHMMHIDYPGQLFFVGLPKLICPALVFDYQMKAILKILLKEVQVPDKQKMLDEQEADFNHRLSMGWQRQHAHRMGSLQLEYLVSLANLADALVPKQAVCEMFQHVVSQRRISLLGFRKVRYRIESEDRWSKASGYDDDYDYRDIVKICS